MAKEAKKTEISYSFEQSLVPDGETVFCGADEAGRGPLAGRVYAAACILPKDAESIPELAFLNDSKKLTEKKRDELAEVIKRVAVAYCIEYAEVEEIERDNILNAALHSMDRAIKGLKVKAGFALVDGNKTTGIETPCVSVVSGDARCPSIAAASILAKTARDAYCKETLDVLYPEYGFAVHKGYGTKAHYKAVDEHGLCPEHRPSFFKKYFEKQRENDGK